MLYGKSASVWNFFSIKPLIYEQLAQQGTRLIYVSVGAPLAKKEQQDYYFF